MKKKILFLCTGNACRSQMAEGWLKHLGGDAFEVMSAGIETHGLNPRAVQVMAEVGVDISGHASKLITSQMLDRADLMISVCAHAEQHCPLSSAHGQRVSMLFDDPAKAQGSEAEIMAEFRRVRDQIREQVEQLIRSQ